MKTHGARAGQCLAAVKAVSATGPEIKFLNTRILPALKIIDHDNACPPPPRRFRRSENFRHTRKGSRAGFLAFIGFRQHQSALPRMRLLLIPILQSRIHWRGSNLSCFVFELHSLAASSTHFNVHRVHMSGIPCRFCWSTTMDLPHTHAGP